MQNTLLLSHGKLFAQAGELATLWRVKEGVLRLDQVAHDATILVQLAFPGDLVGVEALCAEPYAYTLTALTACKLAAESVEYDYNRFAAVAQGFMQQQDRTRDMMRMRTGPVRERLAYFLKLLSQNADGSSRKLERCDLPTHKEIAVILDVASETVCRELNAFMPAKVYKRGTARICVGFRHCELIFSCDKTYYETLRSPSTKGAFMKFSKHLITAAFTTVCAVSAFAQNVTVSDAWARATVPGQKATGAFMKITAKDNAKLVSASSPAAGVVEIHEMKMDKDVMKMAALPNGLELPAGKAVELKPGGYHVMLMDLKAPLAKDSTVPLTLTVQDAKGVKSNVELKVQVGMQAPMMQHHKNMDHNHGDHKH